MSGYSTVRLRNVTTAFKLRVVSGFRCEADENCSAMPGYCAARGGNSLPTFRDNLSVPSSRVKNPSSHGPTGCPETSVWNYHYTVHSSAEESSSEALR